MEQHLTYWVIQIINQEDNQIPNHFGYVHFPWPPSFDFRSIEFGGVMAEFYYISQNYSTSSDIVIITLLQFVFLCQC